MKAVVSVLGIQKPSERFGKDTDRHQRPQLATWRCNLTGLSQRDNLFFAAYTGNICVYEPKFPSQALPLNPALVINTPPSRTGLTGTLDPRSPRAINYLVIQDLGVEEILAVARDDGDVEAYLVAHIVHAVERRAAGEVADVRPFFQSNLGLSAWGLAVHSNARVLAASSNTHDVTIFKFGLVAQDYDGDVTRREDVRQSIVSSDTNIPCIAFCNSGDDPQCRWLLTTDIQGHTRAIDLRTMQVVQTFLSSVEDPYALHNRRNAGWTVMFLDRRSFVKDEYLDTAIGTGYGRMYCEGEQVWDLSRTVAFIEPRNNTLFSENRPAEAAIAGVGDDTDYDSGESTHDHEQYIDNVSFDHPRKEIDKAPSCGDCPCPFLTASVRSVSMFQPAEGPFIGFTNILRQSVQYEHSTINMFERINMHAYIPSLGVVVLASQKGRAMVLALTRLDKTSMSTYAMRINAILPFPDQEDRGERPFCPLMGIAVGPVQGTEGQDQRRWRLMMTYYDQTILSYEIRRDFATRVDGVVV